jgi:hypothetical protein
MPLASNLIGDIRRLRDGFLDLRASGIEVAIVADHYQGQTI